MWRNLQRFYSVLEDKESREIYLSRLMYTISGDNKWLKDIVCSLPEGKWFYNLEPGQNDYIFGCGHFGQLTCKWFDTDWKGFVDNNWAAHPHGVMGLTVYPPEELPQNTRVFLAVKYHAEEIKQQLISKGIREENIINVGKTLYDMGVRQYFDLPYLPHHEKEVFVDAGALNGDTSLRFIEWCHNKFEHIYCFEPDRTNIEKCHKNLEHAESCEGGIQHISERYTIIPKAVYDKKGEISFDVCSNGLSKVGTGTETVPTASLDEELFGKRITFIKMDIEGAELHALQGARNIIKKQRPTLAISVYHKPEDIIEIPNYILELNTDYQFYLRHYSLFGTETVLYAISNVKGVF